MRYEVIRRQWRFRIDDELWNVVYNHENSYWHVSCGRVSLLQVKRPFEGTAKEIEDILDEGIKAKALKLDHFTVS